MIKYDLISESVEVDYQDRKKIKHGIVHEQEGDRFPNVIESFDSKDEALEALKKCETSIYSSNRGYEITEYYIEENEYDEDGECIEFINIWETSEMNITVVATEPFERLIGIYDNYRDAEYVYDDYLAGRLDNYEEDYEEDEDGECHEIEREAKIYMGLLDEAATLPLLDDSQS